MSYEYKVYFYGEMEQDPKIVEAEDYEIDNGFIVFYTQGVKVVSFNVNVVRLIVKL